MSETRNLADPSYEPSDEELQGLAKRAFAGLSERHERRMADLEAAVAKAREEALRARRQRVDKRAGEA